MELIKHIDKIEKPFKNAVITIGNFDGVHIGHQALFHEVIEKADAIDGTSIAMTFEPHPIRVLKQNGHPPLITLYEQKVELIDEVCYRAAAGAVGHVDAAKLQIDTPAPAATRLCSTVCHGRQATPAARPAAALFPAGGARRRPARSGDGLFLLRSDL